MCVMAKEEAHPVTVGCASGMVWMQVSVCKGDSPAEVDIVYG